jgi:hypothetical protein
LSVSYDGEPHEVKITEEMTRTKISTSFTHIYNILEQSNKV